MNMSTHLVFLFYSTLVYGGVPPPFLVALPTLLTCSGNKLMNMTRNMFSWFLFFFKKKINKLEMQRRLSGDKQSFAEDWVLWDCSYPLITVAPRSIGIKSNIQDSMWKCFPRGAASFSPPQLPPAPMRWVVQCCPASLLLIYLAILISCFGVAWVSISLVSHSLLMMNAQAHSWKFSLCQNQKICFP